MQWLQPTPEISAPVAFYPTRRLSDGVADAPRSKSWSSHAFPCEVVSDVFNASEPCDALLERDNVSAGMPRTGMELPSPPQLTPSISPLSTSPPPPPPVCCPLESAMVLQTPSPTCAFASSMPFEQLAVMGSEPFQQVHELSPTLLGAAQSFTALGAWSATGDNSLSMVGSAGRISLQPADLLAELVSVGSLDHDLGKCKPCAFVHRPVGCADGRGCTFCHLCEPGERKRRQKQKLQRVQERRHRRMAASATSADSGLKSEGIVLSR